MTLPVIVEVIDTKYIHTELHIDTGNYITTYRRSRDLDLLDVDRTPFDQNINNYEI